MPTYEYACTECGDRLEVVQSFSDANLTVCPECGGRLRKVFSPVGVVFKGSGFYKTDSRKPGSHAESKSETKSESKTDSKSDSAAKSESKSDSATSSAPAKSSENKPAKPAAAAS